MTTARTQARHRGFTLTELLVAMMAGLIVAAAAFSFSKQATRFFAQEARVASAQMSVLTGFTRLQNDIARASNMSTPNMRRELDLGKTAVPDLNAWPQVLRELVGLRATVGGSNLGTVQLADGHFPDAVRISGSMTSMESFDLAGAPEPWGVGTRFTLQVNKGPMLRSRLVEGSDMHRIFRPGRVVRLQALGYDFYEVILDAVFPVGQKPTVTTMRPMQQQDQDHLVGYPLSGDNMFINVIDIVDYGIASLRGKPVYASTIYDPAQAALGDDTRTELVRREVLLTTNAAPLPIAQDPNSDVIAEYAVDLRLGLWVFNAASPGLAFLPPSSGLITDRMTLQAQYLTGQPVTGPGSVRAVQLRLAVRSREVDRAESLDLAPQPDGAFFRFPVPGVGFARARTMVATVQLANQRSEL